MLSENEIIYLNHKINAYNWQSAVMNGTIPDLPNITKDTPETTVAYIKGRLDEHFGYDEEDDEEE